jgi:predicted nucleotidyltransferase
VSAPRLRLALLFGSNAVGSAHAQSDVDVAILPEQADLPLADELRFQAELSRGLDAPSIS